MNFRHKEIKIACPITRQKPGCLTRNCWDTASHCNSEFCFWIGHLNSESLDYKNSRPDFAWGRTQTKQIRIALLNLKHSTWSVLGYVWNCCIFPLPLTPTISRHWRLICKIGRRRKPWAAHLRTQMGTVVSSAFQQSRLINLVTIFPRKTQHLSVWRMRQTQREGFSAQWRSRGSVTSARTKIHNLLGGSDLNWDVTSLHTADAHTCAQALSHSLPSQSRNPFYSTHQTVTQPQL